MSAKASLREAFISELPAEDRADWADREQLDAELNEAVRRAEAAWPDIELDPALFVQQLARHVDASTPGPSILPEERLPDMFLAAACAAGVATAVDHLRRSVVPGLRAELATLETPEITIDDTIQQLMLHVLVAEGDAPPRITNYGGRGPLIRWLRTIAARMVLRGQHRPTPPKDTNR